jgi:competence protein ComEA
MAEEDLAGSAPRAIDPNTAGRAEWDRLPGIGPVTAIAIVNRRRDHGPFAGPADLLEVRGIGPATLEKLAPFLDWSSAAAPVPPSYANLPNTGKLPDLNRVDAAFLTALPGFGPELADRILSERQARGAFHDWEELLAVEGIGPGRLGVLQSATRLRVSGAPGGTDHQGQEWNR